MLKKVILSTLMACAFFISVNFSNIHAASSSEMSLEEYFDADGCKKNQPNFRCLLNGKVYDEEKPIKARKSLLDIITGG